MAQNQTTKLQHPELVFWLLVLVGVMIVLMILPYIAK